MIITPSKLYGIDKLIARMQSAIDAYLSKKWLGSCLVYGRLFENERDNGRIIEAYSENGEFVEPFISDKHSATVGFRVLTRPITNDRFLSNMDIIFSIDTSRTHGDTNDQSEQAIIEAYRMMRGIVGVREVNSIKTGVDSVFSGINTASLKYRDILPFFVFAFNVDVEYFQSYCDNQPSVLQ